MSAPSLVPPPQRDPSLDEAEALYRRGSLNDAEAAFQRILAKTPGHVEARLGLARAQRDQGRLDSALASCHNAMAEAPDRADVFTLTGEVLSDMGRSDQALGCLSHAVALAPDAPAVHLAMGRAQESQGNLASASDAYRRALASARGEAHRCERLRSLNRLGAALDRTGDRAEALACFDRVLAEDPDNPSARHLAAALREEAPDRAPRRYVTMLFDTFSSGFDRVMAGQLAYRTPERLRALLDAHAGGDDDRYAAAADLGCGTGLSGTAFRGATDHLTGVDLSAKMIEKARAKKIYDRLAADDICEFLLAGKTRYDLFIAADVLVYTGDLAPVLTACRNAAAPGAKMVFSTESTDRAPYRLRRTGRFAHHADYVRQTAASCDWQTAAMERAEIRKDGGAWIEGDLFLLVAAT